MYFDGQLHYLDKDNKSGPKQQPPQQPQASVSAPAAGASHARAHTADPSTASSPSRTPVLHDTNSPSLSTPALPTMPNSSLPKSQTVGGTAGDLHSMALKSAINNIGNSLPTSRNWPPQLTSTAPHFTKRPSLQKRMLSAASPAELLRTTLSPADISFRAITYLPDELLYDIPETGDSALSLFQGFKASLPESSTSTALRKGSKSHSHRKSSKIPEPLTEPQRLQRERDSLLRDLEILTIRKVIHCAVNSNSRVFLRRRSVRLMKRYKS
jgi:hypothetical protein